MNSKVTKKQKYKQVKKEKAKAVFIKTFIIQSIYVRIS